MDSYRVEERASMKILLPGEDAEIGPLPAEGGGRVPEPEMDLLSKIIKVRHEFSI
jgi:type I restriction enzyme R subunit